jgi:hypothetical protein
MAACTTLSFVQVGIFALSLIVVFAPPPCSADCTCTTGSNGVNIVGLELMATQCPGKPYSETQTYTYRMNPLRCEGAKLSSYSSYGDTTGSPQALVNYLTNNGYRVLRNESGTHLLAVQKGSAAFIGSVSNVNMATAGAGVYYANPISSMDQYCTEKPLPDQDQDGIPDCLELPEIDIPLNLGSPLCMIKAQSIRR